MNEDNEVLFWSNKEEWGTKVLRDGKTLSNTFGDLLSQIFFEKTFSAFINELTEVNQLHKLRCPDWGRQVMASIDHCCTGNGYYPTYEKNDWDRQLLLAHLVRLAVKDSFLINGVRLRGRWVLSVHERRWGQRAAWQAGAATCAQQRWSRVLRGYLKNYRFKWVRVGRFGNNPFDRKQNKQNSFLENCARLSNQPSLACCPATDGRVVAVAVITDANALRNNYVFN